MDVVKLFRYLNHSGVGPLHNETLLELDDIAKSQKNWSIDVKFDNVINGFESVRKKISTLIQSNIIDISLTTTTSFGISLVLESLDWFNTDEFRDEKILISDLEFNSNSFPFQQINSNGLRISPHFYNTFGEIDYFLSSLKLIIQ